METGVSNGLEVSRIVQLIRFRRVTGIVDEMIQGPCKIHRVPDDIERADSGRFSQTPELVEHVLFGFFNHVVRG